MASVSHMTPMPNGIERHLQVGNGQLVGQAQPYTIHSSPAAGRRPHYTANRSQTLNGNVDQDRSLKNGSNAAGDISRRDAKHVSPREDFATSELPVRQSSAVRRLVRSRSEYDTRHTAADRQTEEAMDNDNEMRHGWEDQYNSEEYLHLLSSAFYMYFTDKRHETGGKPKEGVVVKPPDDVWHRDRTKTVSAALLVCLNLGVDPPDIIRTNPAASMECWIDIANSTQANPKILENIGRKLQEQYEQLSIKTRYKQYLDPTIDETKKLTTSLRRNAKDERCLFHYNGHGVPLPTPSGEIWVFNKDYTQYIPISLYDLQTWLAGPSLYIFDCSHAGNVIINFEKNVAKHEAENAERRNKDPKEHLQNYSNNIQLAACGESEHLPTNPKLPADLFTCCLTTPIQIAVRYHLLENPLKSDLSSLDLDACLRIPGRTGERRSPMGELNWILTAITDTIAWNMLPRVLFRKLFRQDLMVAALFRNFLVAERVMRAYECHPTSMPQIPSTSDHPLWRSWDLAVEMVLSQLPAMELAEKDPEAHPYEYRHSTFFAEQLTAFDIYLQQEAPQRKLPTQLPIVLQVLLSQAHRLRALFLLSRFLDLGPWAVNLSLTIGIFPYVVKLLQSPALELKPIMIFIWARIIAVDQEQAQNDLLRDNGYQYFTNILLPSAGIPVTNASEHKAMSAFVIAMFCRNNIQGQVVCVAHTELISACIQLLEDHENPLLRQWICLCISMLWSKFLEAKWQGIRCLAHYRLCGLVIDPVPEVRAAAIHALTNFLGIPDLTDQVEHNEKFIASALLTMTTDGNPMVRRELAVFFSHYVKRYRSKFLVAAYEILVEERDALLYPEVDCQKSNASTGLSNGANGVNGAAHNTSSTDSTTAEAREAQARRRAAEQRRTKVSQNSIQGTMYLQLLVMTVDMHPEVSRLANAVVDYIHSSLLDSPLASYARQVIDEILQAAEKHTPLPRQPSVIPLSKESQHHHTPTSNGVQKNEGYLSIGMRRSASIAAALKSFVGGGSSSASLVEDGLDASHRSSENQRFSGPVRSGTVPEWTTLSEQISPKKSVKYQKARLPLPRGFKEPSPGDTLSMPLESTFFDWSVEYFREPQMRPNEPDEPGSDDYNSRLWRRVRNERVLATTQPLKTVAGASRWDIDAGFFNNVNQPMKMSFHQFEDHLATADDRDGISVWNWARRENLGRFSNGNPRGSRINEVRFINEDDQAMLLTGSSDGVIKIFRNYWTEPDVELVSAFRALTDMQPSTFSAGLVLDWQQGQGKLLVAGDVKVIRVWNAATEICTNDIPARSGSPVTCLTSDSVAGQIFCAGFGNGALRVFDQRIKPPNSMVMMWRQHNRWITNVHMQRGGYRELISGDRDGSIMLWDIRNPKPVREINGLVGAPGASAGRTLRTLSVHEHAPVFATGSDHHQLTLFNVNGAHLNTLHPWSPFLSTARSTPISSSTFHPHRMMLAAASIGNGHVNIYTCADKK